MKTTICDICGISTEEIRRRGLGIRMHHLKEKTFLYWQCQWQERQTIDICDDCLELIKKTVRESRNDKTTI